MKTIVEINNNNYGSTGKIMMDIAKTARNKGFEVFTCCKNSKEGRKIQYPNQIYVGIWIERVLSNFFAYITSLTDHFNLIGTCFFLKKLSKINPDVIHLHNIHGNFINIRMLFNYIKKNKIPVVWTFHDNWPFTGQCATYGCDKWENGCGNCPKLNVYPKTCFLDLTKFKWRKKKGLFSNIENLVIVTPSLWLNNMIDYSFLKEYKHIVINNGIDLEVFKPRKSDFKERNNIPNSKHIVLGVANYWNNNKGLDVFVKLASDLPNDYQIVMVGVDQNTQKILPKNIISINRTYNQIELAEIYSCADVFVNPTRGDNFPTVNIEAIACGTPVLTFDVGGSAEIIDPSCGVSVRIDDYSTLNNEIQRVCSTTPFSKEACVNKANKYDSKKLFYEYTNLY